MKKETNTVTATYKTNEHILCLSKVNKKIMCGCDNGQIIFVDSENVIYCGRIHKKYISIITTDESGNIYTGGGDRFLCKWNYEELV